MSELNNLSRTTVRIDRLVLRGIEPHHAEALAESLKQQLALNLSDPSQRQHILRAPSTPVLSLGRIPLASGRLGARDFGAKVARAIGNQLSGPRSLKKGVTR